LAPPVQALRPGGFDVMTTREKDRRYVVEAAIILAAWTVFGLILTSQIYIAATVGGRTPPLIIILRSNMLTSYLWALETVVVFSLARHVPLERRHLLLRIAVHIVAALVISAARIAYQFELMGPPPGPPLGPPRSFSSFFWNNTHTNLLNYALFLGIAHAVMYYERFREGERNAERLAAGLTEARLQALKMQLQPHFLFNTLNAISALIPAEAQPARRMVSRLGDLLRIALEHEDTQEVTLREELAFLEPYLEIEQVRLEDRLNLVMDIAPDTLEVRVPHLLLQPLVENAIRHGIASRIEPGTVELSARRSPDNRFLQLEVRDDGPGLERDRQARTRKGVGLANVQSRLEQLYGSEHRFTLKNHPVRGVAVNISLPLRNADTAPIAERSAE
jgi:signal transduction histidine kinase